MTEKQKKFETEESGEFLPEKLPQYSPNEIMMEAVKNKAGKDELEVLERMFDFDLKVKEQQAKEAFNSAMAAFKADPPKIYKDKNADFGPGKTKYSYADLAKASEIINKALSIHGLSASWRTDQPENGSIKVTCIITHQLGHSESTSLSAEPDASGSKNKIQAIGSTTAYLERYTLFALTGLAPEGMDNDAHGEPVYISTDQAIEINDLLEETGANEAKFLKVAEAEKVEQILESKYKMLIGQLQRKKDKLRQPGE